MGSFATTIHVRGIRARYFLLDSEEVAELPDHVGLKFSPSIGVYDSWRPE
jgi:hypothetical protein